MNLPAIIIGAGGHARVLASVMKRLGITVLGVTDLEPGKCHPPRDLILLGGDDAVGKWTPEGVVLVNGIGSVGPPLRRQEVFTRFQRRGYHFLTVIDPTAVLADDVELGEGTQIMAGAVVQTGTCIGENTILNTGVLVDHDCQIGAHVHLAPGVILSGAVQVGDGCHLGTGATVIQGVSLGDGCLVAAGAVVVKDLPSGVKAMGVPARMVVL